jgi:hypothetical protein
MLWVELVSAARFGDGWEHRFPKTPFPLPSGRTTWAPCVVKRVAVNYPTTLLPACVPMGGRRAFTDWGAPRHATLCC